jgi:hypothetical protein
LHFFPSVKWVPTGFSLSTTILNAPENSSHSREVLEPLLRATPLTAHDIRAAMTSDQWNTLQPRNAQVAFLAEFAERECGTQLSNLSLADAFGLMASNIRTIRAQARKKQKPPHRPLGLTDDQKKRSVKWSGNRPLLGFMSHKGKY